MSEERKRKGKRKGRERKRREGKEGTGEIDIHYIERKKEDDARSNRFAQQSRERCRINDICGWLGGCGEVAFACRHNDG